MNVSFQGLIDPLAASDPSAAIGLTAPAEGESIAIVSAAEEVDANFDAALAILFPVAAEDQRLDTPLQVTDSESTNSRFGDEAAVASNSGLPLTTARAERPRSTGTISAPIDPSAAQQESRSTRLLPASNQLEDDAEPASFPSVHAHRSETPAAPVELASDGPKIGGTSAGVASSDPRSVGDAVASVTVRSPSPSSSATDVDRKGLAARRVTAPRETVQLENDAGSLGVRSTKAVDQPASPREPGVSGGAVETANNLAQDVPPPADPTSGLDSRMAETDAPVRDLITEPGSGTNSSDTAELRASSERDTTSSSQAFTPGIVPNAPSRAAQASRSVDVDVVAQTRSIPQQLATHIVAARQVLDGGTLKVEVTLDPPELGRVSVELADGNEQLTARVLAADPTTLRTIQTDLPILLDSLQEAGVSVDAFEFGDLQSDTNAEREDERAAATAPGPPLETASGEEVEQSAEPRLSASVSTVDIIV